MNYKAMKKEELIRLLEDRCEIKTRSALEKYIVDRVSDLFDWSIESVVILLLDEKGVVVCCNKLFTGTNNHCAVYPRELFKFIFNKDGYAYCIIHNHPGNNDSFSKEDIKITKALVTISKALGCDFIDHFILGKNFIISAVSEGIL